METPIIKLSSDIYETVYLPSEDSFLLIDALELEIEEIKRLKPLLCLEIGSGSGIVLTALAMALQSIGTRFLAVDINPNACNATQQMSKDNNTNIQVVQMDLVNAINGQELFDVIIFNPPYVTTDPTEVVNDNLIYQTWAGGSFGRQIIDRLYDKIPQLLSKDGSFYLLVIKQNDPNYILKKFEQVGMKGQIVIERKIPGEYLYVLRFYKIN